METNYQILIGKLDDFIRRFYRNQIIRGLILNALIFLSSWAIIASAEFYGHFSIPVRTSIFYISLALFITVLVKFILIPVLQFFRIGKIISHDQAANIISTHFTEIQDSLLNTLELGRIGNMGIFSRELIIASIDQRIEKIRPISFPRAINKKTNYRYIRILLVISLVITALLITTPSLLTEGAERIVNHRTYYEAPAPFRFILLNDTMSVQKGGDFELRLKLEGEYIPENVSISYGGNYFLMARESNTEFHYQFRNINNPLDFYFLAEVVKSGKYTLNVLPSPSVVNFQVIINVPEYTGEKDRIISNAGDFTIPCGSEVKWLFNTYSADRLSLTFSDTVTVVAEKDTGGFSVDRVFYSSSDYSVSLKNSWFTKNNIVKYSVNVVPDLYPTIKVSSFKDSTEHAVFFYRGIISDDYGFTGLSFNYRNTAVKDSLVSVKIPLQGTSNSQEFYFAFDFTSLAALPGNKIEYYFEIWDNDGVNGRKSSRTNIYEYNIPSEEDLEKIDNDATRSIEDKLEESMKLVDELKKDIDNLRENLINRELTSWEKTKMLENITQKQNTLERLMDQVNDINQQRNEMMNTFSEQEQELIEKQKQIEELLQSMMDEELMKLMDELNKLMQDFDKKKFNEISKELEMNYDDLSEQLDRNLEILKQYEVERQIENTIEKLNELAEKQEQLSADVLEKNADQEGLTEEQKNQQEEFKKTMEEYKKALEKNNELKKPMNLQEFQKDEESIQEEFQEGSENMESGNEKKASKNQKQNSSKLQQLSASMKGMMQQNQSSRNSEDMDALRQIIENLITFSFDQEALMEDFKSMNRKDPRYMDKVAEQKKLQDNFVVIKDSLNALAKINPMLSSTISKEILAVNVNIEKSLDLLEESQGNNVNSARTHQQYSMTSANNLALLLSEVLEQMQKMSQMQCQGNGQCTKQCTKPGNGKPKMGDMRNMQQSLKSQLESMIQQLKDGGKNPDKNSMNKQLAKMLAQQEIFQNELGKLMNSGGISPEMAKKLNEIRKLVEQTQNDIINKNITPTTVKRQDLILTRLLEAENSDYQREIDDKRKSNEAKLEKISNPKGFFEYKRLHSKYNELLNTSDIKLYKYYNDKYKEYMIKLNEE
ncbi:MAG: DUF4175 family protein [Bacteroidota bacterium]